MSIDLSNQYLKPILRGEATHPYAHATKLFVEDNYRLAPKSAHLYYVYFDVNPGALSLVSSAPQQYIEAGMLAKRVELPKFNTNTKTLNAYNRKNIIQTHITYDPITIQFHDDAADVVLSFWNDYYSYYYRDSDYTPESYTSPSKYQPRANQDWGFTPRSQSVAPFLNSIKIYSMHNKEFTEYILINPSITAWRHGEHNSSEGGGLMEHSMTIAFETVQYRGGVVDLENEPIGLGLHYDNYLSPISSGNEPVNTYRRDFSSPDSYYNVNYGAPLNIPSLSAVNASINNLTNRLVGGLVGGVVNGINGGSFYPTMGGVPGYGGISSTNQLYAGLGVAGLPNPYALKNVGKSITATIENAAVGTVAGAATAAIFSAANTFDQGVNTLLTGSPANPASSGIYNVNPTNGLISIGPDGQPVAGQSMYLTQGSQNGLPYGGIQQTSTSSSGQVQNGLYMTKNGYLQTPGSGIGAQLTNTISGAVGAVAGLEAGSYVTQSLNSSALGKTVVGRIVSGAVGIAVTNSISKAVNNGLQSLTNGVTGSVSQVWNSATGSVDNVISRSPAPVQDLSTYGASSTDPGVNQASVTTLDQYGTSSVSIQQGSPLSGGDLLNAGSESAPPFDD